MRIPQSPLTPWVRSDEHQGMQMHSTQSPPVILLSVDQVMDRIGRGRTTVFALIRTGELEAVRFGRRTTRIPSDSVDSYIARARREARRATQ